MVAPNSFSVHNALVGTNGYSGAIAGYWGKLDVGALFLVRRQSGDQVECPVVTSIAPGVHTLMPIANLITSSQNDFQAAAVAQTKVNSPVPEAVAAAASLLTGGSRHLVLITTGAPDSCLETNGKCAVDPSIKAVQDARSLGITTHVIGVGNTDNLSTASDKHGYETYVAQLANAGAGKPVKKSAVFDAECSGKPATAVYSTGANGDAHAHHTERVGEIDAAIVDILKSICP